MIKLKMGNSDAAAFRPLSLWVGRSYRGLTISELSQEAGVSRQVVSAIENGASSPTRTTPALSAMADTLGFPMDFFFSDQSVPEKEALHFRKGAKVTERAISQARARTSLFARFAEGSRTLARFSFKLPVARPSDPEAIEKAAESFRIAAGIGTDAPMVSAIRAAEASGVFVGTFSDAVPIDGFTHFSSKLIMLNANAVWSRRRLSVLHEVGHLVLHGGETVPEQEEHANRFASAALCPRAPFWREFPRPVRRQFNWASLIAMKQRWGVSIQALVRRAFNLGLIDAAQFRTACIHISQIGWRTAEPAEQEPEVPQLCRTFLEKISERGETHQLSVAARLPVELIAEVLGVKDWAPEERSRVIRMKPRAPAG